MIRNLIAAALLALVLAPLVTLHQLGGVGVRTSVLIVKPDGAVVGGMAFEGLLRATRL
ncbi:MAG TPA: hypothetical protein VFR28_10005 [Allosphingosinicella sp.]|jgi:hypothetical protein|nr:hypothetical protein [Allosphingosinicella sp.]